MKHTSNINSLAMHIFNKTLLAFGSFMFVTAQAFAITPPVPASSSFKVGMYPVADTYKMNVMIERDQVKPLTVTLKDKDQKLVHKHFISAKTESLSQKIDFENLEDGTYFLTISDGASEVVKEIKFSSKDASDFTYHALMEMK